MVDAYVATMLLVQALAVSGFAVSSAMRLASEERAGRLEPLLATGLSRTRWLLGSLLVTTVGSVLVLLAGGLGLGAAYAVTTSEPGSTWSVAWDQLIYLPAVLVSAALAVALLGWVPRWTNLAWGVLSVYFVLGWLGGLIHPPDLLQQLSPFHHVPAVPVEAVSVAAPLLTLLVVTLLTGVGVVGLRRRDVE
jgi:ABC-2 type transport system permease protein